jgi:hypothetical protein
MALLMFKLGQLQRQQQFLLEQQQQPGEVNNTITLLPANVSQLPPMPTAKNTSSSRLFAASNNKQSDSQNSKIPTEEKTVSPAVTVTNASTQSGTGTFGVFSHSTTNNDGKLVDVQQSNNGTTPVIQFKTFL